MEIPTLKSVIKCSKCGEPHGYQDLYCSNCHTVLPTVKQVRDNPSLGHIDRGDGMHADLIAAACEAQEFFGPEG